MNVYTGRADAGAFATALRVVDPHLVAVQELSSPVAEVLDEWATSHLLDPRDDTTGMGMAARIPVDLERIDFPHRDPVRAIFDGSDWGLTKVEVVNAHIVNPIARPLMDSRRLRQMESDALERLLVDPSVSSKVLIGDLNSSPAWPLYRRLARVATDGALAAGTARRTWGYFPNSPALLRIDHVFTKGVRCSSTRLVRIPGADHRGLVVDIEPLR